MTDLIMTLDSNLFKIMAAQAATTTKNQQNPPEFAKKKQKRIRRNTHWEKWFQYPCTKQNDKITLICASTMAKKKTQTNKEHCDSCAKSLTEKQNKQTKKKWK